MTDKKTIGFLGPASAILDLLILLIFLFMPRSGMEELAVAYLLFPIVIVRLIIAVVSLVTAARQRRWLLGGYTLLALLVLAWFWVVGSAMKPTYEPLHKVLRQEARLQLKRFGDHMDRRAYDARRERQHEKDPLHGQLCDTLADSRDPDALNALLAQDLNRPCTTYDDDRVSPLLHAVIHTYGPWSGGDIAHPPLDEDFLAPAVERLLAAGADPDLQDAHGNTALHYALTFQNEALLDVLLDGGACVLIRNQLDESPLSTHSTYRLRQKIEKASSDPAMLDHCPTVTTRTPGYDDAAQKTPDARLLGALRSGRLEPAIGALTDGADPNAVDREGTVFEAALRNCRENTLTMSRLLIESGADVQLANARGETPLRTATKYCQEAIRFLLDRGADPTLADRNGDTVLHDMSRVPDERLEDTLNHLLAAGADIDQQNRAGQTPLIRAVHAGATRNRLVTALIDRGAALDLANNAGNTALHVLAARRRDDGAAELLTLLAARGAALELRNRKAQTPLIAAVREGSEAAVAALIQAGADVDARRARGTPMLGSLIACDPDRLAKLDLLLNADADTALHSDSGPLPLAQAFYGKAYLDCLEPAERLLEAGADPNLRDGNGRGAIHGLAVWDGKDPRTALELLLRHGADIELKDQQGMTALLLAARNGTSLRTLERLVEAGASTRARDGLGNTLLHAAAMNSKPGSAERYQWVLDHGGDPGAENFEGQTPQDRARLTGNTRIIELTESR